MTLAPERSCTAESYLTTSSRLSVPTIVQEAKIHEADVDWLRNTASERFGHQRSRNRILQNPDIAFVEIAVQFNDTYHKKN
jgi:hypothetical protein